MSASIKELEKILQASLVDRTKRRVLLTPLGLDIVERARRILLEGKELVEAARAESEPLSGTLGMGVISTVGPFLLPKILPRLRRVYPALRLCLVEDPTARLIEGLHAGKFDVGGYCFGTSSKWRCQVVIPLAAGKAVDLEQLQSEGLLLLKEGHCLREHALAACRLAERRQLEPVEATSLHTLVQMVDNGLGITLLPSSPSTRGFSAETTLTVLPITGEQPSREMGLVWRRGTGRQREFDLLASVLTQFVEERPRP